MNYDLRMSSCLFVFVCMCTNLFFTFHILFRFFLNFFFIFSLMYNIKYACTGSGLSYPQYSGSTEFLYHRDINCLVLLLLRLPRLIDSVSSFVSSPSRPSLPLSQRFDIFFLASFFFFIRIVRCCQTRALAGISTRVYCNLLFCVLFLFRFLLSESR